MDVPLSDLRETLEHFLNEQVSEGQDDKVANRDQIRNQIERSYLVLNTVSFNSIRAVCNTNGRAPRSTPAADGYVR